MSQSSLTSTLPPNLTLSQIVDEIQRSQKLEVQLDEELAAIIKTRDSLESQIDALTFHNPNHPTSPAEEVATISTSSVIMCERITHSAASASTLSSKVRQLDSAQSRLAETVQRVNSVLELRETIEQVQRCIRQDDIQGGCNLTFPVLHQRRPVKHDSSYVVLCRLEDELQTKVLNKCRQFEGKSENQDNLKQIIPLSKLLPSLNLPYKGLW